MGNNEDLFDVVDEHDCVIGQRSRRETHELSLTHRAVHVLVFNGAGELYLQKRSTRKDRQPGVWDSSASGHVDHGEDYDAAAVRELEEELGVKACPPPARWFKMEARPETDHEFVWVYLLRHEGPFNLNADEIDDGGWFSLRHVERWMAERPGDFASVVPLIMKRARELGLWPPQIGPERPAPPDPSQ